MSTEPVPKFMFKFVMNRRNDPLKPEEVFISGDQTTTQQRKETRAAIESFFGADPTRDNLTICTFSPVVIEWYHGWLWHDRDQKGERDFYDDFYYFDGARDVPITEIHGYDYMCHFSTHDMYMNNNFETHKTV